MFFDDVVGLVAVFEGAFDERVGEEPDGGLLGTGRGQLHFLAPGGGGLLLGYGSGALGIPELGQS